MASSSSSSTSTVILFSVALLSLISSISSQPADNSPSAACKSTLYPKLCRSLLSPTFGSSSSSNDSYSLGKFSVKQCTKQAGRLTKLLQNLLSHRQKDRSRLTALEIGALEDCLELSDTNFEFLESVSSELKDAEAMSDELVEKVTTLLSGTVTNQQTCIDGLVQASGGTGSVLVGPGIGSSMGNTNQLYSVALGLVTRALDRKLRKSRKSKKKGGNRFNGGPIGRGVREPLQVLIKELHKRSGCKNSSSCSRLERNLQSENSSISSSSDGILVYDYVIVSPSGDENFTSITEAVAIAPNKTKPEDGYFVIYAKEGTYEEYIVITKHKKNIMLIGDGINRTIITGNHSVIDGWTTFNSSSFAVAGERFTAVDVTFRNTAGPEKHQAVALRNNADLSTFYRCSFEGYQDTLYVHSLRQFYRECNVYGTVDFIFGNAAAVFQNCNLYARKGLPNQKNAFTAQGRTDPYQNTGISIHNCTIEAAADLKASAANSTMNYLGRPWKMYSRTVVMESYIGDLIQPVGWLEWNGTVGLDTLYYGEFRNHGPGSDTGRRVRWPGYNLMNVTEAVNFTVYNLTTGDTWLPYADVPFTGGLFSLG
ncbi:Probable pectinesterase/pectinesterase inhibitor 25 [Linum perenne]